MTFQSLILRFPGAREGAALRLGAVVDWLAASHWRALAALAVVALICFVPGSNSIPPIDRDEARFVQSTKQMLESGNYIDIRFQEGTRYKKPIGIYWLQAAAVKFTGQGADAPIGTYRLASIAGALAAVLLTYWACLPLFGRRAALIAAAGLALSVMLVFEAHSAKTDAVLLAMVVLMQGSLARVYLAGGARASAVAAFGFWIGLGLGILVKGPIAPMIAGLTLVALVVSERRVGWLLGLRPALGIPLLAVIVLPWFIAIAAIAGKSFFDESVGNDLLGKMASVQESHGAPPGTHFALFWLIFAPASLLVPAAIGWIWREKATPAVRFCLAWIIPSFVVIEAVATKLPHYALPLYPAVAMLIGGAIAANGLSRNPLLTRVPPLLGIAGNIVLGLSALFLMARYGGGITPLAVVVFLLAAVVAVAAAPDAVAGAVTRAVGILFVAAVPLYVLLFGIALPKATGILLTPRIALALNETVTCEGREVATVGYSEASLIFALGTGIRLTDAKAAAEFLAAPVCRVALVTNNEEPAFLAAASASGVNVAKRLTVEGLNIGHFGMEQVALYTAAGQGP